MKCPIKLSPSAAKFIKDNDLVYFGKGSSDRPFVSAIDEFLCESFPVCGDGTGRCGDYLRKVCGAIASDYYFIRRADAAKHFPHALPKPRQKNRYFNHTDRRGFSGRIAYFAVENGKPFFVLRNGEKTTGFGDMYTLDYALRFTKQGLWKEITKSEALKLLDPKPVAPPAPKAPEVRKPKIGEVWRNEHQNYLVARVSFKKGFLICPQNGNRADNKGFVINDDGTVNKLCPSGIQHFVAGSLEAYFDSLRAPVPDPRIDAIKKILA